jgi:CBS domain-containing protein
MLISVWAEAALNVSGTQEDIMNLAGVCTRTVHTTSGDRPLAEAAGRMLKYHVGALPVVDSHDRLRRPVGIVTDRDIVCGQVDRATNLHCLTVADVMTAKPVTLPEHTGVAEAIETLSQMGVRRALVVNDAGILTGIVSIEDLLPIVADELGVLARLLRTHPILGRP